MTKNLEINVAERKKNCDRQFASWDHVTIAFEMNKYGRSEHHLNHITNEHIYKDQIRRMSVKHAAQVFGARFAEEVDLLAEKEGVQF